MKKNRLFVASVLLVCSMLFNSGCALIGTALGAGAAYGIYQATRK
jgi:hypothetical protein